MSRKRGPKTDITEVRKKMDELSIRIANMVDEFEEETGLFVVEIEPIKPDPVMEETGVGTYGSGITVRCMIESERRRQ